MISDPFQSRRRMLLASILSADFSKLGAEMDEVMVAGADFFHLDVMDGHFVPNISFGPPVIAGARKVSAAFFDAHLMISEPLRYAGAIYKAGAQNITFQVEAVADCAATARAIGQAARDASLADRTVGITLNPATPIESIYPALEHVRVVLVMSVVPGFSGQRFMPEVLKKCETIKPRLRADQRLEIDGGINPSTIASAKNAGVDWFVVASAIFDKGDRRAAIAELRRLID